MTKKHHIRETKILVVDDDPLIVHTVKHHLLREGYQVLTASNGMEALQVVENENIDLIITDIMMPELSGLNLINFFREFYSIKVPIIIITSLGQNHIIYPSLKQGANDFLTKPIDFSALSMSVKNILRK